MGSVVKSLFGGKKEKATQSSSKTTSFGPGSPISLRGSGGATAGATQGPGGEIVSNTGVGGQTFQLFNQGVAGINRFNQNISGDIASLRGLGSAFRDASVRPIVERLEAGIQRQREGLGRRNVGGGLAEREIFKSEREGAVAVSDAETRAQAAIESAIAGLRSQQLTGAGAVLDASQQRLATELAEIGVGMDTIKLLFATRSQTTDSTGEATSEESGDILGTIGTGLDIAGRLFP